MSSDRTFVLAASPRRQLAGVLILAASLAYLLPFVSRGWVPHDEGMIGQSAELVLSGAIPHVDYEEPYTGALTWLYAALFAVAGVDLVHVRWLLFAGASLALWTAYSVLRRHLDPVGAAFAALVALVWSFPNYFAGLPSWWILVCALVCLWALIRHIETGRLRYVVVGGLAVGIAIVIKQTGVYLLVALIMSLAYQRGRDRVFRFAAAGGSLLLAFAVLRSRLDAPEVVYLLLPVAACSVALLLPFAREEGRPTAGSPLMRVAIGLGCAALPIVCLMVWYGVRGQLDQFIHGVFLLPQKRLTFASTAMRPASWIFTGLVAGLLMLPLRRTSAGDESRIWSIARLSAAVGLTLLSLWSVIGYQLVWQSSRAVAALLPLAICALLASRQAQGAGHRQVLFLSSSMLAWASLVQFPFAAPIYFCYVAPLAVITAVGAARARPGFQSSGLLPWGGLLLAFAVFSMNRGYIYNLGLSHVPQELNAPLDLPRAHLKVSPADAHTYRQLVGLIERHLESGALVAEPDSPEVYFLTGTFSRRGAFFDFFSEDLPSRIAHESDPNRANVSVVILNHEPPFSPPPSTARLSEARSEFPHGQRVGRFEVRWR